MKITPIPGKDPNAASAGDGDTLRQTEAPTIIVVPDAPCPKCGQGFPNRPKEDDWFRCYRKNCTVLYYRPHTGEIRNRDGSNGISKAHEESKLFMQRFFPKPDPAQWAGVKVWQRNGAVQGEASGHTRKCNLEGCPSHKVMVRWPGGRRTWPCARGLVPYKDGWRIE
jgi:hypothetical protein